MNKLIRFIIGFFILFFVCIPLFIICIHGIIVIALPLFVCWKLVSYCSELMGDEEDIVDIYCSGSFRGLPKG